MFKFTKEYDKAYSKSFDQGLKSYFVMIYAYVAAGLLATGLAAFLMLNIPFFTRLMFSVEGNMITGISGLGMLFSFVPLAIGLYFQFKFGSMTLEKAKTLFWVYSITMGIALCSLGLIYTGHSIARTFLVTASAFAGMSLYGYTSKQDLSQYYSLFFMGLIGIIIASVINIFLKSSALEFATSLIGIIVFMGFIAFDTQRIKAIYYAAPNSYIASKYAIQAAFTLYLNFINLFLYLLRFLGDRRD
ncbi:MAG: Bax inhibitor-1/YccA family protein [Rickettsiales bacterium]